MAEQGERMRAVIAARPGGPEALQIELRSRPAPSEREILVRVEAAGVIGPTFTSVKAIIRRRPA